MGFRIGYWYFEPNNLCQSKYYASIDIYVTRKILLYLFLVYMNIYFIANTKPKRKLRIHLNAACVWIQEERVFFFMLFKKSHTQKLAQLTTFKFSCIQKNIFVMSNKINQTWQKQLTKIQFLKCVQPYPAKF